MITLRLQPRMITTVGRELPKRPDIKTFLEAAGPLGDIFSLPTDIPSDRVQRYREAYFGIGDRKYYQVNLPNENRLFLKMEYANAMGNTHYSRFWLVYLFIAETLGAIDPEVTRIIEVTSGSSGIALAMASEAMDYHVTILVPAVLPENRVAPMRRRNVTVIPVKGYINECITELRRLIDVDGYYATNHSEEKADVITHVFARIGHEVIRDAIRPDVTVLAMGNGTSTLAIARALKSGPQPPKIFAYRPNFEEHPEDIVYGLIGANIECRHIQLAMQWVDELCYTTGRSLEGIERSFQHDTEISNLGYSSLHGVRIAMELAQFAHGKTFLSLGYDKKDRY